MIPPQRTSEKIRGAAEVNEQGDRALRVTNRRRLRQLGARTEDAARDAREGAAIPQRGLDERAGGLVRVHAEQHTAREELRLAERPAERTGLSRRHSSNR